MNALLLALIIPALPNVDPPYPETSTNIAIAVNMARLDMVSFALNMSQPASNEVVVAVGKDADNDGDLSFGEAAFIFGCDDSMHYYADLSTGSVVESAANPHVFKSCEWNGEWNLVKVIKRGLGVVGESVDVTVEAKKLVILLR